MRLIQNQVCILLFALVCRCNAEFHYILQSEPLSWDEARARCKACYDDLVTLTPDNNPTIVSNLTCGYYWIGLRRNFSSDDDCPLPWSQWANGDPLTFQNWYPDWARTEPSPDHPDITTNMTTGAPVLTTNMTTGAPVLTTNMTTGAPVLTTNMITGAPVIMHTTTSMGERPNLAKYCVAMSSFGPWVKMNCSKPLPSFCYEDHFYGNLTVTKVTPSNATLTWSAHPKNISHYMIKVNGLFKYNVTNSILTRDLSGLTPGTRYSVQVIPVKCNRHLGQQSNAFYTEPGKINNLKINSVTETSVSLSWSRPDCGPSCYYVVEVEGLPKKSTEVNKEAVEMKPLTPGSRYTFTVTAGVGTEPRWGEAETTTVYTKPGKVSDLTVTENTGRSVVLKWASPVGNHSGYRVKIQDELTGKLLTNVSETEQNSVRVKNLPEGTNVSFTVTSLVNGSVEGDPESVIVLTAPEMISNLGVVPSSDKLVASWSPPRSRYTSFIVELQMSGSNENTTVNGRETTQTFNKLNSGTKYKVTVYTLNGEHRSKGEVTYKFTLPMSPNGVEITKATNSSITLKWNAPTNSAVSYSVQMFSKFWSHTRVIKTNQTTYTFDYLNSGTRYDFEVRTVAGGEESEPCPISRFTEAEKREITLSMMCSSKFPLHCDKDVIREDMFKELMSQIKGLLGETVFWELKRKKD